MLEAGGGVATRLGAGFELRPQQVRMAEAVAGAMASRSNLLVEAGTGVGKSFAYLAPAIQRILAHGERVLVATNTIALQEQLIEKDVPLLQAAFEAEAPGRAFRAELVKGRGNYLSIRRLELASRRQQTLLGDAASRRSLHVIEDWAYGTSDGSLSTLPQLERPAVWSRAQSDSGNCMGRKCPRYDQCFYQSARRRMERADLLVCNHALLFSDLALRARGVAFLPRADHVILDEAHGVEAVASEHFGASLAEGSVRHLLGLLYNRTSRGGFLAGLADDGSGLVDRVIESRLDAEEAAIRFFESVVELGGGAVGTVRLAGPVANPVTPAFRELAVGLKRLRDASPVEEDRFELSALADRAGEIAVSAEVLAEQALEGCVYWAETGLTDRGRLRVRVACSPVEVGPLLAERLFGEGWSTVLTSATLTTVAGDFTHAQARLGAGDAETLALGSPFDHAAQMELHVDAGMPDPRSRGYVDRLAERIVEHVRATDGGAFVLFTSFDAMHRVADRIGPELEAAGHGMWVQGRDGSRRAMLEGFRSDERSVLLGTSSFWQGVDVRGRGLRNVIITRLPFEPPDRPLTQARMELIASRGGNAFMEETVPRAVIRFKQGFGRLIRSASDEGRVVVLDPRIVTARYGRLFLGALPEGVRAVGVPGPGTAEPWDEAW